MRFLALAVLVPLAFLAGGSALSVAQRAIPKSGELLPVIGLGSADTFSAMALRESRTERYEIIGAALQALVDGGGTVLDTA